MLEILNVNVFCDAIKSTRGQRNSCNNRLRENAKTIGKRWRM